MTVSSHHQHQHQSPNNRSSSSNRSSDTTNTTNNNNGSSTKLSPQEAALRGASLAFQKQKQQVQDGGDPAIQRRPSLTPSQLSRQTTGAGAGRLSRQTTGSSTSVLGDAAETERERRALFLSPDLTGGGNGLRASSTDSNLKSASFIAATLAASRSASPGTAAAEGGGSTNTRTTLMVKGSSPLRQPVDMESSSRRSSGVTSKSPRSSADHLATDTTSLPPTTSLISLFENKETAADPVKRRPAGKKPRQASLPEAKPVFESLDLNTGRIQPQSTPSPRSSLSEARPTTEGESLPVGKKKPKPGKKPKPVITQRASTPPPPPCTISSANTDIVSPKPRKPEKPPRWETATPSSFQEEPSGVLTPTRKAKPKPPIPKSEDPSQAVGSSASKMEEKAGAQKPPKAPTETPSSPKKARPKVPRKRSDVSERQLVASHKAGSQRQPLIAGSDGQVESSATLVADEANSIRPMTANSTSSNESFVSASSAPTRDENNSILTTGLLTSTSSMPRLRPVHVLSTQPSTASLPVRRTPTGSSQLPIESLSDAIMASSLASARHTPVPVTSGRTPPPLPPSRRTGIAKHKTGSRKSSPHRMRQTMRQPASKSDDEDSRRPHHHHKKGLNHKKHAHHEGSRSRWREEITEREKKRYEAVWASNRGLLLTESLLLQQQQPRGPTIRNESYEAASEHVANVVVRDIWSRSRLPVPELAEVWDLVYGHGPRGPLVHAALNKQEFVVGMWLIDQRLRGRKIPPRVTESVWDSANGLRVLNPAIGSHHHHK